MKSLLYVTSTLISVFALCCRLGQKPKNVNSEPDSVRDSIEYFSAYTGGSDVNWMEVIPVYHYWRSGEGRTEWAELCEREFLPEPTERHYVQGNFRSMNHYVTVYDFVEVLFKLDSLGGQRTIDDEFVLWRLHQYDTLSVAGSEAVERKKSLRKTMDSVLDFTPNTQWDVRFKESLAVYFDDFYSRVEF